MNKLNNIEISLIQNKIDGNLSSGEEEIFNTLLKKSEDAQKYYFELLGVHSLLSEDSEKIKEIDITDHVFSRIENKKLLYKKPGFFVNISNYKKQIISYAAILIVGFFAGFLANQITGGVNNISDTKQMSGTFINKPDETYKYDEKGTEIRAHKFEPGEIKLYTISVKTSDLINIIIKSENQKLTNENIDILSSDGEFNSVVTSKDELNYLCKGKIVFQIIGSNELTKTKILFLKEGRIIYEIIQPK